MLSFPTSKLFLISLFSSIALIQFEYKLVHYEIVCSFDRNAEDDLLLTSYTLEGLLFFQLRLNETPNFLRRLISTFSSSSSIFSFYLSSVVLILCFSNVSNALFSSRSVNLNCFLHLFDSTSFPS